jgi:hypothetical protein
MSFLKKMTKEFEDLKSTFTKGDEKKEQKHGGESTQKVIPDWKRPYHRHTTRRDFPARPTTRTAPL